MLSEGLVCAQRGLVCAQMGISGRSQGFCEYLLWALVSSGPLGPSGSLWSLVHLPKGALGPRTLGSFRDPRPTFRESRISGPDPPGCRRSGGRSPTGCRGPGGCSPPSGPYGPLGDVKGPASIWFPFCPSLWFFDSGTGFQKWLLTPWHRCISPMELPW